MLPGIKTFGNFKIIWHPKTWLWLLMRGDHLEEISTIVIQLGKFWWFFFFRSLMWGGGQWEDAYQMKVWLISMYHSAADSVTADALWPTSPLTCRTNHTVSQAFKTLDCKTVGFFFSKSVKKSVKRGVRVLRARRASLKRPVVLASLPSVALWVFNLVPDLLFDC